MENTVLLQWKRNIQIEFQLLHPPGLSFSASETHELKEKQSSRNYCWCDILKHFMFLDKKKGKTLLSKRNNNTLQSFDKVVCYYGFTTHENHSHATSLPYHITFSVSVVTFMCTIHCDTGRWLLCTNAVLLLLFSYRRESLITYFATGEAFSFAIHWAFRVETLLCKYVLLFSTIYDTRDQRQTQEGEDCVVLKMTWSEYLKLIACARHVCFVLQRICYSRH